MFLLTILYRFGMSKTTIKQNIDEHDCYGDYRPSGL